MNCFKKLKVVKIPVKGLGVIAVSPIRKEEVTCNYNGDLISTYEADEREENRPEENLMGFVYNFRFRDKPYWFEATGNEANKHKVHI